MKNVLSIKNLDVSSPQEMVAIIVKTVTGDLFQAKFLSVLQSTKPEEKYFGNWDSFENLVRSFVGEITSEVTTHRLIDGIGSLLRKKVLLHVGNLSWMVSGDKTMKKMFRNVIEGAFVGYGDKIIDMRLLPWIKSAFLVSFRHALAFSAPIREHTCMLQFWATYYDLLPFATKVGKARFLYSLGNNSQQVLEKVGSVLQLIASIPDPPAFRVKSKEVSFLGLRFKQSLLSFVTTKLQESGDSTALERTCEFFHDFFSAEIELYMTVAYNNDYALISSIYAAFARGHVKLQALTCPAYSGYYDADGCWNFDFKRLGTDDGVVAQKSYRLIETMYKLLSRDIAVEICHSLPAFEFKNGFSSAEESISMPEVRRRLNLSLDAIGVVYRDMGIPVVTSSTETVIANHDFFARAANVCAEVIKPMIETDPVFGRFFKETLQMRGGIYRQWYPQGTRDDGEYQFFLSETLAYQLAEYYCDSHVYHNRETLLIFADSPQLASCYSFWGIPAFCGHGKGTAQYRE